MLVVGVVGLSVKYDIMILCDMTRQLSSILNENTVFEPIPIKITVYRGLFA